ncbi:MAG: formate dehydrogenase [Burkholderiales bacterium]|nr:MAG: formate dehydrogenase [Burkholderiales bacterium]TAG84246.1 MAG: formate dehydrogenase [Betaproteobacteria bacterium]
MKKLNHWIVVAFGSVFATVAIAKLPVPVLTDEQKAKAEEAKVKAADAAKKAAADEARYQDRVAERWFKEARAAGKTPAPSQFVAVAPTPPVAAPSSSESHGQKQTAVPKSQNTSAPAQRPPVTAKKP